MTAPRMSPIFRKMAAGLAQGEILVPLLRSRLWDPDFKGFDIHINGYSSRPPDGWFHPSTHPMFGERLLYYYISQPEKIIKEIFDPASTMTVTQGQFWHEFFQNVLLEAGALQRNPQETGRNPAEWFWSDPLTKARGWSDGLTVAAVTGVEEIAELKTMRGPKAAKIPAGAPDSPEVQKGFRDLVPGYYAQAMEYMRLSGRRRWRCVIVTLEWPFPLREVVLDYDQFAAYEIAEKYRRVLQAVADHRPPPFCCSGGKAAVDCPARGICEMGRVS